MMRLRRITWKPSATLADRRACGEQLRLSGYWIVPIFPEHANDRRPYMWHVRRAAPC